MATMHRAHVIGSMLRTEFLKRAHAELAAGSISAAEAKRIEDRAVDQAIARQEGAGIGIVTDGEMRRANFGEPLNGAITGIGPVASNTSPWQTADGAVTMDIPVAVTGKVQRRSSPLIEEFSYARARARVP